LERVKAVAAAEPKPLEFLKGGAPEQPSLESQLAGSLQAEQAMKQAGLTATEQSFVRSGLRSAMTGTGGTAMSLLPVLIDKPMEEQFWSLVDPSNIGPKALAKLRKFFAGQKGH
jgi:hypothetical protein